jgi:hypothetical protein
MKLRVENGIPGRVCRIRGGDYPLAVGIDQGEIGNADNAAARISVRIAEGIELLEVNIGDADLFLKLARRGLFERFADLDESARERPMALEWFQRPTNKQHPEVIFGDGKDHQVYGDGRTWVITEFTHLFIYSSIHR